LKGVEFHYNSKLKLKPSKKWWQYIKCCWGRWPQFQRATCVIFVCCKWNEYPQSV